jgi:urea transport system permease protein
MSITAISEALSNSLSFSSILILSALGLAITFGVMRIINMAHGDMMMLGAYTTFVVTNQAYLGWTMWVALPISFLVVAFIGYLLEVTLIRHMYGRPLDTLLCTWGVGMIVQQCVNMFFGADQQSQNLPSVLSGGLPLSDGLVIPYYRLFIVGVTAVCLLGVSLWFYQTPFGLKIRAVVQNRSMASALGVNTRWVDSLTFAFATGLAGVAGSILAYLYTTKYTMGNDFIVEAFMVVTLGGMGQLAGSVGAGTLYGTSFSFVEKGLGSSPMAKVIILLLVVTFLLIRPAGLFATKERSYE